MHRIQITWLCAQLYVILCYRLSGCCLSVQHCETVCSALQSSESHLRELDMSNNDLLGSGVRLLCARLNNSHCQLNILRFDFHIYPNMCMNMCFTTIANRWFPQCILYCGVQNKCTLWLFFFIYTILMVHFWHSTSNK